MLFGMKGVQLASWQKDAELIQMRTVCGYCMSLVSGSTHEQALHTCRTAGSDPSPISSL